jgi:hypothetical protein
MEKIVFKDYETLADMMFDVAEAGDTAYAVCFFDDAAKLLKELMSFDETSVGGINIMDVDYNGYSKEYYISIDGDYIIDVQPAYSKELNNGKGAYLTYTAEKTFIVGEANSVIIKGIDDDKCYEIEFDTDKHDDGCDVLDMIFDNAKIIEGADGEPIGIGIDVLALLSVLFGE